MNESKVLGDKICEHIRAGLVASGVFSAIETRLVVENYPSAGDTWLIIHVRMGEYGGGVQIDPAWPKEKIMATIYHSVHKFVTETINMRLEEWKETEL